MGSNVGEDPPLFMHSHPAVVRMIVIDWNSTLEAVVVGWRESDEPSIEQGFGLVVVRGAGLTSTLKLVPFIRILPETW